MNDLPSPEHTYLINLIHALASELPHEMVEVLATKILAVDDKTRVDWSSSVINIVPNPRVQMRIEELLVFWQDNLPEINADSLAFSLLTAAHAVKYHRETQLIELIWTGPQSHALPLRRTDQALLQLIKDAKQRLLIVSFAVYKVRNIVNALIDAAQRDVAISIILESANESEGKLTYDAMSAMGTEIRKHARFYTWPLKNRTLSPDGEHGSLHAKVAVADGRVLFISSANLTDYAMNLNMEMGVLIHGGKLPSQAESHFDEMILNQELSAW